MNKRATRRHHTTRLKKKRLQYEVVKDYRQMEPTPERVSRMIDTPKPCSCHMCGNPRKHWNEKTIQEKKFDLESPFHFED